MYIGVLLKMYVKKPPPQFPACVLPTCECLDWVEMIAGMYSQDEIQIS